ncbi:MAG: hypothetical protein IT378_20835, partial [Sandaracinaceae bacterium]|nr:hypothetical protein [Sandaracinaceae bacterium]
ARFQNLVQAPALIGPIAAALLLQGTEGSKTLLHPTTLKRLGDDVDLERRGRDGLHGARRAAEERARIRGLTIGRPTTTLRHGDDARAEVERLGIEPRLVLRPIEGARWEVSLEIPDLSHLLLRFPQAREVLTESRCTVAGAAGRPLARGRCLHGPQRVALSRWPRPDDVLLKFERTDAQLEYLLRAECMLRPGSSWLFKVASDGLAYESRGMRVRAGTKYVLVGTEPCASSPLTRSAELTCQGVHAVVLDVPSALTQEWQQALRQLRISPAKSIEVWPAGLAAVAWDGEGHGEWLASETPTLAIRSDHAIDELTVALGNGPSLSLALNDKPGDPIFIELPSLPVGLHRFSIAARSGNGADSEVIGDLDVVMRVREARPWSPGATTHGPLEPDIDPAAPSLEQLWEGKAALVVRGPAGRQAKIRVKMFVRPGETPSFERLLPLVTLPLTSEEWTRQFETLKRHKEAHRAYDDARLCEVEFSAEELGGFTLRCEREFTPLRWSLRRRSTHFIARLHDDVGSGAPLIERYSFERPDAGEKLPQAAEYEAPRTGGLYAITLGDYKATIIVPPVVNVKRPADLRCSPQFQSGQRTPEAIEKLLSLSQLWQGARLSGDPISGVRRLTVMRAISVHLLALFCGHEWRSAEMKLKDEQGLKQLKDLISRDVSEQGLGAVLERDYRELAGQTPMQRAEYLALRSERYRIARPSAESNDAKDQSIGLGLNAMQLRQGPGPSPSAWFAEFALRMASDPATLSTWAGAHLDASIKKLLDTPTLARAARFLVLALDQHKRSFPAAGEVYAGWGWSA